MVTSSVNETSTNQLRNMAGGGGGGVGGWGGWEVRYSALPHLFIQHASGQIVKDDVDGFSPPWIFASCFLLLYAHRKLRLYWQIFEQDSKILKS